MNKSLKKISVKKMNKILVRFGQYFGAASKKPCFLLATNRHHSRHGRTLSSIASSSPIDCYRKGHSNYDVLRSQCSDVEIPQETLPQFLFKNFPAYAERPAIVSTAVQVQPILYLPIYAILSFYRQICTNKITRHFNQKFVL